MHRKATALTAATACFLVTAVAATAAPCPPDGHARPPRDITPCTKQLEKLHLCKLHPPSTVPPEVTPPPHGTPPPIQATPPFNSSEPREAFCVQTAQRGETFVQATTTSFSPQGDWFKLWQTEATVVLDGHTVTLLFEGGKGVILAANVPGVGLTCAQPYVSTDGVYADPSYGLR